MSGIFTISAIHLGHFAEIDTDEANISTENPEVLLGSHGAPGSPLYDQVSVLTLDAGGDNLFGTDNLNSEPVSYDLGAGPVQTVFDTVAVLDATMHFVDGSAYAGVFYVAQDQFGEVFVLNASGEPDLSASAPIQFDVTGVSAHAGVSAIYDLKNSASSYTGYLCIAEGSEILTQRGPVPIELLRKGDLVMTLDSGMQPLLWIGRKGVMPCEEDPAVWIAADSLG
ncbi:MAG: Hint domain-containing protein, partial [Halocynthiibacter sp.]